jgi:hypothetical protein
MANNSIRCYDSRPISVNLTGNTVTTGETWSAWSDLLDPENASRICVEMVDTNDVESRSVLVQQYPDCYDCLSNNYGVYQFGNCIGEGFVDFFNIPAEFFGSLPNINEVFYMTIQSSESNTITGCFTLQGISQQTQSQYESNLAANKFYTPITTPALETGCEDCLANNSLTYEVTRCTDNITDYVSLINNSYINHIISYSDGINQYCGEVRNISSEIAVYIFINDYGLNGEVGSCDTCLATENQKVEIQSCTNSEVTEVVWASALYGNGEVTNLSTIDGCFEVIGLTDSGVTINTFLNFDPQPGCEPCIECNGIVYEFAPCGGEGPLYIQSYQYLNTGSYFYNPALGECCQLIGTSSSYYGTDILYSMDTFTDCEDCQNNVDVVIWNASACTTSSSYYFNVTTDSTAQIGDVVKLMWGSNEWICGQLINTVPSQSGGSVYYNTQDNGVGTTLRYDTCENCNSQGLIGVTLVSCNQTEPEQFVSITLENYLQIYNFGSLVNYSVSDSLGRCYTITNVCPIPLTANEFTPVEFYLSCIVCNSTDRTRNSGTESLICEICCDCGATGSTVNQITPPHPVWTDGYGSAVRQLNMIVLGGPNGLNN